MNMLSKLSPSELVGDSLLSPSGETQPDTSRAAIQAGVGYARVLRARAFHAAVANVWAGVKRLVSLGRR
tara:strand:- start:43 stop:249 length:207 start_codon:yes stop_codon:yes gene_type:complete